METKETQITKTNSKKFKLEIQIEKLKKQQPILEVELAKYEAEEKEVDNLYSNLHKAERFAYEYWEKVKDKTGAKTIQQIKDKERCADLWKIEQNAIDSSKSYHRMNKALESFKEIVKDFESKTAEVESKVNQNQHELKTTQRKLLRFQLKRQGKELLKCGYSSRGIVGCLGDYWCDNCKSNYLPKQGSKPNEINQHEQSQE